METHDRPGFPWWLAVLLMLALAAGVGVFTYNLGMVQGAAQGGAVVAAPPAGGGAVAPVYVYPRYWHPGWGMGFGFFPFFGLFWVFIFFAFLRRLWWGPRWYRRCGYYGRGYYGPGYDDRDLDEWHRRAHDPSAPKTTQL